MANDSYIYIYIIKKFGQTCKPYNSVVKNALATASRPPTTIRRMVAYISAMGGYAAKIGIRGFIDRIYHDRVGGRRRVATGSGFFRLIISRSLHPTK
jgi:hypothetical protein